MHTACIRLAVCIVLVWIPAFFVRAQERVDTLRKAQVADGRGGGLPAQTFTQIAEDDGVSTQCINRIYQRAIQRMKRAALHPDLDPAA